MYFDDPGFNLLAKNETVFIFELKHYTGRKNTSNILLSDGDKEEVLHKDLDEFLSCPFNLSLFTKEGGRLLTEGSTEFKITIVHIDDSISDIKGVLAKGFDVYELHNALRHLLLVETEKGRLNLKDGYKEEHTREKEDKYVF